MKKLFLSLGLGFVTNNIVATLIAMFILNPLLYPIFNEMVRTQEEGLEIPSLLSGYFLLTLFMVLGYRYFKLEVNWAKRGLIWGAIVGVMTFLSGHLIVAGWATIPPKPMLISGVFDTFAPIVTGVVIAYIY